jgi:hypothetical protein
MTSASIGEKPMPTCTENLLRQASASQVWFQQAALLAERKPVRLSLIHGLVGEIAYFR